MLCENRTVNEGMGDDGPRVAGPGEHTSRRARRLAAQDGAGGPSTPSSADAAAPAGQDGTFPQIEQRFGTTLTWGSDFQSAFDAVRAGGDGTMAVVGIGYSGGRGSHVVLLANDGGSVGIVEGQDWGAGNPPEAITDVNRANTRYNSDGGSNIGWGIVPPRP